MEVLFEYRGSRRQLNISDKKSVTSVIGGELHRIGRSRAQVFTANDDLPSGRREENGGKPEVYLLQKWSSQWDCYVDVTHYNEVSDGDRLAVLAKPKPPSKLRLLCCCGSDSSYVAGKVGGSKVKVPKTDEIQSLEYRYRVETDAVSEWEQGSGNSEPTNANTSHDDLKDGERYIRSESGRAAWKLAESDPDLTRGNDSAIDVDGSDSIAGDEDGEEVVLVSKEGGGGGGDNEGMEEEGMEEEGMEEEGMEEEGVKEEGDEERDEAQGKDEEGVAQGDDKEEEGDEAHGTEEEEEVADARGGEEGPAMEGGDGKEEDPTDDGDSAQPSDEAASNDGDPDGGKEEPKDEGEGPEDDDVERPNDDVERPNDEGEEPKDEGEEPKEEPKEEEPNDED